MKAHVRAYRMRLCTGDIVVCSFIWSKAPEYNFHSTMPSSTKFYLPPKVLFSDVIQSRFTSHTDVGVGFLELILSSVVNTLLVYLIFHQ